MSNTLQQTLDWLSQEGHAPLLKQLQHGLEKEGLRVDASCRLAQTPHPKSLGSALTHSHITTDYSEALLEFITPVFERAEDALSFLAELHRFTYQQLGDEQLWCASMPCILPEEAEIPIAQYGSSNVGTMKYIYRVGLDNRYGKVMQTIAGIHYNFSLPDSFWPIYQNYKNNQGSLKDFRSAGYFSMIRNFRRYSWLLMYLFGASPALCSSFMKGKSHELVALSEDTLYLPYATSLRMSDLGYSNKAQASLNICFNHLDTYASSLERAIQTPYAPYEEMGIKVDGEYRQLNSNILQIENEYYSDIRPKRVAQSGEKPIHALISRGVEYIEVRNTDINPFLTLGIDQTQSDFLDLFLISCLFMDDSDISRDECQQISDNHQRVVTRGREPGLSLINDGGEISLQDWGKSLLEQISNTADLLDKTDGEPRYQQAIAAQLAKLDNPDLTPSAQVLKAMQESNLDYNDFIMQQNKLHRAALLEGSKPSEMQETLHNMVSDSLAQQAEIEAGDDKDFDTYLADYLAS